MDNYLEFYSKFLLIPTILGSVLHYFYIVFASKYKLLDNPKKYGYKRNPLPYSSGISLVASFLVLVLYYYYNQLDIKILAIVSGILILTFVNIIDDFGNTLGKINFRVKTELRLLSHVIVASIIFFSGISIDFVSNPFGTDLLNFSTFSVEIMGYSFQYLSYFLTVIWITGIINIVNFTDGIRAETLGISFISTLVLTILTFRLFDIAGYQTNMWYENLIVFEILLITLGLIFSSLIYEISPEKSLIGDTGAVFCGFLIAVLSIMSSTKLATAFVVLGYPIIDKIINSYRIYTKMKLMPWQSNLEHFHHRLPRAGFSSNQTLLIILGFTLLFGIAGLYFTKWTKLILISIIFILMLMLDKYLEEKERLQN